MISVPTLASAVTGASTGRDAEAARQAALEQDQRERDHSDRPREAVVVEGDPAEAVGADDHADREEQHEARHPQADGDERRDEAGGEQRAGGQDQMPIGHTSYDGRRA